MSVLQLLITCDEQIVDWLLHTTPTNANETLEMRRVFALRSRLDGQINTLVKMRLVASVQELAEKVEELNALSQRIGTTATNIAEVKRVLAIASEVVALAAAIIALAV